MILFRNVIFDTDIGCDCDDAVALAMINHYKNIGKAEVLATTQTTSIKNGANIISTINEFYGNSKIPIGCISTEKFLSDDSYDHYATSVVEKFGSKFNEYFDSIKLLRKQLSTATDNSVTVIVVGPAKNISLLLNSEPDEFSEYSGEELFNKKVSELYVMGGCFGPRAEEVHHCEYNIVMDIPGFQNMINKVTKPVYLVDFETGCEVVIGETLVDLYETNPVAFSYKEFNVRPSWDPLTVLAAFEPDMFEFIGGTINVMNDGFTTFDKTIFSNHYLVKNKDKNESKKALEKML